MNKYFVVVDLDLIGGSFEDSYQDTRIVEAPSFPELLGIIEDWSDETWDVTVREIYQVEDCQCLYNHMS